MGQQWFYTKDGKSKIGPISSTGLQALARSGEILPTDMVWKEGMRQWRPARKIKGLFGEQAGSTAPALFAPASHLPVSPTIPVYHLGASPQDRPRRYKTLVACACVFLLLGATAAMFMLWRDSASPNSGAKNSADGTNTSKNVSSRGFALNHDLVTFDGRSISSSHIFLKVTVTGKVTDSNEKLILTLQRPGAKDPELMGTHEKRPDQIDKAGRVIQDTTVLDCDFCRAKLEEIRPETMYQGPRPGKYLLRLTSSVTKEEVALREFEVKPATLSIKSMKAKIDNRNAVQGVLLTISLDLGSGGAVVLDPYRRELLMNGTKSFGNFAGGDCLVASGERQLHFSIVPQKENDTRWGATRAGPGDTVMVRGSIVYNGNQQLAVHQQVVIEGMAGMGAQPHIK